MTYMEIPQHQPTKTYQVSKWPAQATTINKQQGTNTIKQPIQPMQPANSVGISLLDRNTLHTQTTANLGQASSKGLHLSQLRLRMTTHWKGGGEQNKGTKSRSWIVMIQSISIKWSVPVLSSNWSEAQWVYDSQMMVVTFPRPTTNYNFAVHICMRGCLLYYIIV